MNYVLSAKSLAVGYNKTIVSDISFDLSNGEILTLIGPNGCGKSTILKTLAGVIEKKGGSVLIDGTDTEKITAAKKAKKVSVMFTGHVRTTMMTCREVVETGRYPHTGYFGVLTDRDKAAVNDAINIVGIDDYAESDFAKLSDGQRQRVMLARAVCQEPEILLLDEPTSYLDIQHKIEFAEILRRLANERNVAVIMSMHEIDLVRELSVYTVCIKDGRVLMQGRTDEVLNGDTIKELFNISEEMYKRYIKTQERK